MWIQWVKDKKKIAEYIRHQLDEDRLGEQMTMPEKDYEPFKNEKKTQGPKQKTRLQVAGSSPM